FPIAPFHRSKLDSRKCGHPRQKNEPSNSSDRGQDQPPEVSLEMTDTSVIPFRSSICAMPLGTGKCPLDGYPTRPQFWLQVRVERPVYLLRSAALVAGSYRQFWRALAE